MKKTLAQRIGGVTGFAVAQLPEQSESFAAEVSAEIEKGIADPESYPEAVEDAAEILKSCTKSEHLKAMIDQVADLAVHEDDESWFDEFGDAWQALSNGLKSRRERRNSEKDQ